MKVSKVPKGTSKPFARGGKQKMFGAGDRTKSSFPAGPQKPGQASGQGWTGTRKGASAPVNAAGDMGGSAGSSQPRRPAA
jgi:hypothetical protein